jgi:hypothetical protein
VYFSGAALNYYQPDSEDPLVWQDFVDFLYFFNSTGSSSTDFFDQVVKILDVSRLLPLMVVESFMISQDHLAEGNNFFVYHKTDASSSTQRMIFYSDFDDLFVYDTGSGKVEGEHDILKYFNSSMENFENFNPLLTGIMSQPRIVEQFIEFYSSFLCSVCKDYPSSLANLTVSSSTPPPSSIVQRAEALYKFVLPWVEKDSLWQMSVGMTSQEFKEAAATTFQQLELRCAEVQAQIDYFQSN